AARHTLAAPAAPATDRRQPAARSGAPCVSPVHSCAVVDTDVNCALPECKAARMSRALFLHAAEDARVAPSNLRDGHLGEVLRDVAAVGLCGSDLHYYKDGGIGSAAIRAPFVPGHEFGAYLTED